MLPIFLPCAPLVICVTLATDLVVPCFSWLSASPNLDSRLLTSGDLGSITAASPGHNLAPAIEVAHNQSVLT